MVTRYTNGMRVGVIDGVHALRKNVRVRSPLPANGQPVPSISPARTESATAAGLPTLTYPRVRPLTWAYGIMTMLSRRDTLLPRTLASLAAAGFDKPTMFVDGCTFQQAAEYEHRFNLPVEVYRQNRGVVAAWMATLLALWTSNPKAQRYAIMQDDAVFVQGLREYLDATTNDDRMYWNCYTFRNNEKVIEGKPPGWYEAVTMQGTVYHGKQQQKGLSALALVFNQGGAEALLTAGHMIRKPHSAGIRGKTLVDGGIVESLNQAGYREMISNPSLSQHLGSRSTIGHHNQKHALSFPGEGFSALSLLH